MVGSLKTEGGFWLPNEVVDLHLDKIKARGLALYCIIARCTTRLHYPGVVDLACTLRCSERKVEQLLLWLYEAGLLNKSDICAITGERERLDEEGE